MRIENYQELQAQFKAKELKSSLRVLKKFLSFAAAGSGKLLTLNTVFIQ